MLLNYLYIVTSYSLFTKFKHINNMSQLRCHKCQLRCHQYRRFVSNNGTCSNCVNAAPSNTGVSCTSSNDVDALNSSSVQSK